jgi:hypothetical protein
MARTILDEEVRLAIIQLAECPDTGGSVLAAKWRETPRDTAYLRTLTSSSQELQDARITRAALNAVKAPNSTIEVKSAALQVLASHLEPQLRPYVAGFVTHELWSLEEPRHKVGEFRVPAFFAEHTAVSYIAGREPVTGALRAEIEALFGAIVKDSTAGDLGIVAREVWSMVLRRRR